MCTYPPYQYGVIEELYDNNQSVMTSVDVENVMLVSGHICIAKSLTDIGKTVPLTLFYFCHPFLN